MKDRVVVDFRFDAGALSVVVENLGSEPALDVKVTFSPPFHGLGGTRAIGELAVFRRLAFLGPGRNIAAFIDTTAAYFARGEPEEIWATISYQSGDGRPHEHRVRHDLAIYRDLPYLVARP